MKNIRVFYLYGDNLYDIYMVEKYLRVQHYDSE